MGFRFRKNISISPGVRLNIGKKGISSLSVGKSGVGISIGSNGIYGSMSLPGTGLSYRTRLDEASTKNYSQLSEGETLQLTEIVKNHNAVTEFISNIHTLSPNLLTPRNTYDQPYEKYRHMFLSGFSLPEPIRPEKPIPTEFLPKPTCENIF
ncbi:DUF4236 domain-containing protein [Vibrio owensii]|uniref:DUF4236 domain-containing protein n=1 Tax=Vibrio owensii TaxID=696485 RepID=UPI0005ED749D|nr:DUF4236 domain-containing protein [Vibrio owensii]